MHKGQLCACSTHKNKPSYCEYPSALSGIHGKYAKFIFPVIQYYHFLHAAFSHKKRPCTDAVRAHLKITIMSE